MTKQLEENKLFAEFLEWFLTKSETYMIPEKLRCIEQESLFGTELESMEFHSDWNWIMKIVDKIREIPNCSVSIDKHCHIVELSSSDKDLFAFNHIEQLETSLESTYEACLEFIKYYNAHKETNKRQT